MEFEFVANFTHDEIAIYDSTNDQMINICEEITLDSDVGTVHIGFGKATRSWNMTIGNKFARYASIFWV